MLLDLASQQAEAIDLSEVSMLQDTTIADVIRANFTIISLLDKAFIMAPLAM